MCESLLIWQILCIIKHVTITLATFSLLWSRQFNRHLHLAFKIPIVPSSGFLTKHNDLLKSFCSVDKFALVRYSFTSHVHTGYAPSLIRSTLTFSPPTILVGSISKLFNIQHSISKLLLSAGKTTLSLLKWDHRGY